MAAKLRCSTRRAPRMHAVRTRVWSPDAAATALMTSADGAAWASLPLDPQTLQATNNTMDGATPVRRGRKHMPGPGLYAAAHASVR